MRVALLDHLQVLPTRLGLFALVWAIFWEELTELMFIAAVIYILWVFRRTLLPELGERFNLGDLLRQAFE